MIDAKQRETDPRSLKARGNAEMVVEILLFSLIAQLVRALA